MTFSATERTDEVMNAVHSGQSPRKAVAEAIAAAYEAGQVELDAERATLAVEIARTRIQFDELTAREAELAERERVMNAAPEVIAALNDAPRPLLSAGARAIALLIWGSTRGPSRTTDFIQHARVSYQAAAAYFSAPATTAE